MKLTRKISAAILAVAFAVTSAPGASAVTTKSITPDRIFQFAPTAKNNAMQNFDNGAGTDVYFTQRIGADTLLSRCSRTSTSCTQRDSVTLPGYGHGESLEVFTEGGKTYAWVGSSNAGGTSYFSKDISLIEYIKAPSGSNKASYKRIGTLTGLASIAPGHSGAGKRSAVAIADGSDRLAIRVQVGDTGSSSYYGVYKLDALKKRLMADADKNLPISQAKDLMVSQFKEPGRPHGSFQGFDIKGVGADSKYLYVYGGQSGQAPTIYRYLYTNGGNTTHDRTYVMKGAYIGSLEAEGIKVEKDPTAGGAFRVNVSFNPTKVDDNGKKMFRLYKFAE